MAISISSIMFSPSVIAVMFAPSVVAVIVSKIFTMFLRQIDIDFMGEFSLFLVFNQNYPQKMPTPLGFGNIDFYTVSGNAGLSQETTIPIPGPFTFPILDIDP